MGILRKEDSPARGPISTVGRDWHNKARERSNTSSAIVARLPSPVLGVVGGLAAFGVIRYGGDRAAGLALVAAIASGLLLGAMRNPAVALGAIVVYTPFQVIFLAFALKHGAPVKVVREAGYLKEVLTAGIGLAALKHRRHTRDARSRLRYLDYVAALYVGIATVYLLLPLAFAGSFGGQTWTVRLNAWRTDCLYVCLFLFCRQVPFTRRAARRIAALAVLAGLAMFGSALWENFGQQSYSRFFTRTIDLTTYEESVLHITPQLARFGYIIKNSLEGNSGVIRNGGFFTDHIELGFFSVLPFAIGAQWLIESRLRAYRFVAPIGMATTAILTVTRSAILACAVALTTVVLLSFRRRARARLPVLVLLIAGVLAAVPFAGHTTAGARFSSLFGGNTSGEDNTQHSHATWAGYNTVLAHPTGLGLGANPGTGIRFHTSNSTTTENSYLQVGTELGIPGMIAFALMYLGLVRELWRRARAPGPQGGLVGAVCAAAIGLFVGGFFLQVWINIPVALTFWGVAGAVLAASRFDVSEDPEPRVPAPADQPVVRHAKPALTRV